jgi:hypothetical protein
MTLFYRNTSDMVLGGEILGRLPSQPPMGLTLLGRDSSGPHIGRNELRPYDFCRSVSILDSDSVDSDQRYGRFPPDSDMPFITRMSVMT